MQGKERNTVAPVCVRALTLLRQYVSASREKGVLVVVVVGAVVEFVAQSRVPRVLGSSHSASRVHW